MTNLLPRYRIALSSMTLAGKPTKAEYAAIVGTFENCELTVMDLADAVCKGRPFCAWMSGERKTINFVSAQHIAIDMDTEDEASSRDTLLAHPIFNRYGAMLYPTHRHTEDTPRHRLVFLLDGAISDAKGYKLALKVMHYLFPDADQGGTDIARMYQGNSHATPNEIHITENVLPLNYLRTLARQYLSLKNQDTHNNSPQRHSRRREVENTDTGTMTLEELGNRLQTLDSYALGYEEWVKLCCAIARTYGDEAYGVVKAWSDRQDKTPLSWAKWRSFQDNHPQPAGYGTIEYVLP